MIDLVNHRILVTGGAGFVGSAVVHSLHARGCQQVFVPRRRDYDLVCRSDVERLLRDTHPSIVIHLAARSGGIGANRLHPGQFFYDNIMMGVQLIEGARLHRVEKVVVVGSVCAYPKFAPIPFREDDLWNGYPEETNAPFGVAKRVLLVQTQAYRQEYGLNAIYLLPVNIYRPRDSFDPARSHVIPALIERFIAATEAGEQRVVVWGDGEATREFLYVDDAAEGIVRAAEEYDDARPINIGVGFEVSIRELAGTIAHIVGYTGTIVWDTSKPNGQPRRMLETSRARVYLGFEARTRLVVGLQTTVDWYAAQRRRGVEAYASAI